MASTYLCQLLCLWDRGIDLFREVLVRLNNPAVRHGDVSLVEDQWRRGRDSRTGEIYWMNRDGGGAEATQQRLGERKV